MRRHAGSIAADFAINSNLMSRANKLDDIFLIVDIGSLADAVIGKYFFPVFFFSFLNHRVDSNTNFLINI